MHTHTREKNNYVRERQASINESKEDKLRLHGYLSSPVLDLYLVNISVFPSSVMWQALDETLYLYLI